MNVEEEELVQMNAEEMMSTREGHEFDAFDGNKPTDDCVDFENRSDSLETSLSDREVDSCHGDCDQLCGSRRNRLHKCVDGKVVYEMENIYNVPEEVFTHETMTHLVLDYNSISKFPDDFCSRLQSLKVLSVLGNKLIELPSNIDMMQHLEHLSCDENRLSFLPNSLCKMSMLSVLHLQGNRIAALPDCIHELKQLKVLRVNENKLKSLPESIGFIPQLIEFDLSFNSIVSLPESFGSFAMIRTLNLSHNKMKHLESSFGRISTLVSLEISSNSISSLPTSFESAKCLQKFYADNNEICILPQWFGELIEIQEITLQNNYLRGIQFSESFGINSQKLVSLDISGNLMEALPESFASITTLKFLDTGSHQFEPERRKDLRNGNNISLLPKDFGLHFYQLSELRLDEMKIEKLPDCFGDGMPNLQVLDLYCNNIEFLPDSFCKLTKLELFSIGMNCLKRLPTCFGHLIELKELRAETNQLSSLPPTFDQLINLRILDLFDNKFDAFPSILKNLPNIKCLEFDQKISNMVIKIDAQDVSLEKLNKAIQFAQQYRHMRIGTWLSAQIQYFMPSSHNKIETNDNNLFDSPSSSAYFSSHDQKDTEMLEESWDHDVTDPKKPYKYESITFPESQRIPTPVEYSKDPHLPHQLLPTRLKIKRPKLASVEGQFDDAEKY